MSARPGFPMRVLCALTRAEISRAFQKDGLAYPREIARRVCQDVPGVVAELAAPLAQDAVTVMVRKQVKRGAGRPEGLVAWLILPADLSFELPRLPFAISIPNGSLREKNCYYRPLAQATLAELEVHLGLLNAQIEADKRRFHALQELHDIARAMEVPAIATVAEIQHLGGAA